MPASGPPSIATTMTTISKPIMPALGRLSSAEIDVTAFTIATTPRTPPAAASAARRAPHGISQETVDRRAPPEVSGEDAIGDTIGGSISAAGRTLVFRSPAGPLLSSWVPGTED